MLTCCHFNRLVFASTCILIAGCSDSESIDHANSVVDSTMSYDYGAVADIKFQDSLNSNASVEQSFAGLKFTDTDGKPVQLSEFIGKKNLVLVFTRGFAGSICPYCSTQTSRLISNYGSISKRNAEVVVVYPLLEQKDIPKWDEFLSVTREKLASPETPVPFPVLFDIKLDAVNQLGIQHQLSKPATYILDPQGQIRFAYVGSNLADRPSIKAILEQLDKINPVAPVSEDKSSK